jgi:hypothetical protein
VKKFNNYVKCIFVYALEQKERLTMTLSLNPLHVLVPAWFVGLSLIGIARLIKQKRSAQLDPVRIKARQDRN